MQTHRISESIRERIIRGKHNWWFLGPGGIARLGAAHITAEGTLAASTERHLRENGFFSVPTPDTYALTVLTSTDCNLGCAYCFQNTGQDVSGGNRPPRIVHSRLTSDTITNILEFTKRQMSAAEVEKLSVLLFGGEPLLNPRGCQELLARASDYGLVSAEMISNATLLSPELAIKLADLGLKAVQVTFDGDTVQHDRIRVRRSGGGTFDAIVQNMVSVSNATSIKWNIRVNVSHHNHAQIGSLIENLAERIDTSACQIYFAWVGDTGIGYANSMQRSAALADQFFVWQRQALKAGFEVSRPGPERPCLTCSFTDGRYGAVVNADGTLSSCWETAGKPGWQVGSVVDGYLPAAQTEDRWVSCLDSVQYSDDSTATAAFNDAVDAALLDYLLESDRLR